MSYSGVNIFLKSITLKKGIFEFSKDFIFLAEIIEEDERGTAPNATFLKIIDHMERLIQC